jgi:hypothetical protein
LSGARVVEALRPAETIVETIEGLALLGAAANDGADHL